MVSGRSRSAWVVASAHYLPARLRFTMFNVLAPVSILNICARKRSKFMIYYNRNSVLRNGIDKMCIEFNDCTMEKLSQIIEEITLIWLKQKNNARWNQSSSFHIIFGLKLTQLIVINDVEFSNKYIYSWYTINVCQFTGFAYLRFYILYIHDLIHQGCAQALPHIYTDTHTHTPCKTTCN